MKHHLVKCSRRKETERMKLQIIKSHQGPKQEPQKSKWFFIVLKLLISYLKLFKANVKISFNKLSFINIIKCNNKKMDRIHNQNNRNSTKVAEIII